MGPKKVKYCDVGQEGSVSGTANDRLCQTQFNVLLSECAACGSRNEACLNKTQTLSNIEKKQLFDDFYIFLDKNNILKYFPGFAGKYCDVGLIGSRGIDKWGRPRSSLSDTIRRFVVRMRGLRIQK